MKIIWCWLQVYIRKESFRVCVLFKRTNGNEKKVQLCWDERTLLIHKHSHTAANETLVDSLPCKRTEAGVRSGHNRKRSRDYMKGGTDSLLRMNLEEVKVFIPGGDLGGLCSKALFMTEVKVPLWETGKRYEKQCLCRISE